MRAEQHHRSSILIVDDTPENLAILTNMLTEQGYRIHPAITGEIALEVVRETPTDLILLDIMMPGMDGYEVCRRLKADKATRDIPVLFISALQETFEKVEAFAAGGIDYIAKPFQEEEVLARVHTQLALRKAHQQLQAEAARFRTLTDAAFEGIVLHENMIIVDVNLAATRLLNTGRTDLIGARLSDYIPDEFHEAVLGRNEHPPQEITLLARQDERIPVEIQTKALGSGEPSLYVTAIRDLTLQKAAENRNQQLLQENSELKIRMHDSYSFEGLIGWSAPMQQVYTRILQAADSDCGNVVISGESGTGKELVARAIHQKSSRAEKPFVPVNCGAVAEALFEREFFGHRKGAFTGADRDAPGYFDTAHQGTLFLDEFGELSPTMQVKLLRVLESGQFTPLGATMPKHADVSILAATNRDLHQLVESGQFRQDLFYRIHILDIHIPPLRERIEDIPLLIDHFLTRYANEKKPAHLPRKVMEMLLMYEWPGNVRELQHVLQRYLTTGQLSLAGMRETPPDTAGSLPEGAGLQDALDALEYKMIVDALQQARGHRGKVCDILRLPRRTLQRRMLKYGLRSADEDSDE